MFFVKMLKKFQVLIFFFLLCEIGIVSAQSGHTIGVSIGGANFLGDLGGANAIGKPFIKDLEYKLTRPSFALFYKYNVNEFVSFRVGAMFTELIGDDKLTYGTSTNQDAFYRRYRNLNFKSPLLSLEGMAELNLYKYIPGSMNEGRFAPFITGGFGGFWFNPRTRDKINGQNVKLKPLGTEGQGMPGYSDYYKLFALQLIGGFGFKFNAGEKLGITLQANYHHTFTDYIDDVSTVYVNPDDIDNYKPENAELIKKLADRSPEFDPARIYGFITTPTFQRGDPKDKDQFLNVEATFNFFLGNKKSRSRKSMYSCPTW